MSTRYDVITVALAVPVVIVVATAGLTGLVVRWLRMKATAVPVCICRAACSHPKRGRR